MIARTWRGWTSAADADRYLDYLEQTGLSAYRGTDGNRGALALRSFDGDRAEVLLVSFWDSMEAVRRFAGDEPEVAVFYAEDDHFLVDRETRVRHFEVLSGGEALSHIHGDAHE